MPKFIVGVQGVSKAFVVDGFLVRDFGVFNTVYVCNCKVSPWITFFRSFISR